MIPEATILPPHIPDYELLRLIGRGSYGDVWLSRGATGHFRAAKIIWRDRFSDLQPYEREFKGLREFAAVSLTETRQLALLHVGRNEAAGFFYYVMELADDVETGQDINPQYYVPYTLREVKSRQGRVSASTGLVLGIDLAHALAGLHARGLVHRDIKPSNVIFVGGLPKLADIGLVTASASARTFVGTEGFVPPEGPGTPSADVFSLGKLLYELTTGLDRHDYPRLPPDLSDRPDRKELLELNEIFIRACDPVPARRYPDAAALLDDLLLLKTGRSMRRMRLTERRLSRAVRGGVILTIIAAIAVTGGYVERQRAVREYAMRRQAEAERDDLARKSLYAAGLARSQRSLELGNLGQARRQLSALAPKPGAPDLRGFEWSALFSEAQGDPADVLREGGPTVERVRFSTDGRRLAIQCADQSVTLWDTATLKPLCTISGIHRLAGFSADGQWLVGSDAHFALQRWSVGTGALDLHPAPGINRPIALLRGSDRGVCFTDGVNGAPHALRIWDFAQHAEVLRLPISSELDGEHWDFYRAAFSTDSHVCAIALVAGRGFEARWKLICYELSTPKLLHEEIVAHLPTALALSPDGSRLALAFRDTAEVEVRAVADGLVHWRNIFSSSAANMIAFTPDGLRLAIGSREQVVRIADASNGALLHELHGHEAGVEDIGWSPDGQRLISAGSAGDLRYWHVPAHKTSPLGGGFWTPIARYGNVLASHDGTRLAVTRDGKTVDILKADSFEVIASIPGALRPIAFAEDDQLLLALTPQGALQGWQLEPKITLRDELLLFEGHAAIGVTLSPDRRWLAASDTKGKLRIWDWPERQLVHEQKAHAEYAWAVAFSPDSKAIATSGADRRTRVWSTHTAAQLAEWVSPIDTNMAQFAPCSGELALGLGNGDVELRDPQTLALTRTLHTGSARVHALTFSPDGSRMLCGAPNGLVHVFATDDWRELVTLSAVPASPTGAPGVVDLDFSRTPGTLAAYLADGRVRVWRW